MPRLIRLWMRRQRAISAVIASEYEQAQWGLFPSTTARLARRVEVVLVKQDIHVPTGKLARLIDKHHERILRSYHGT